VRGERDSEREQDGAIVPERERMTDVQRTDGRTDPKTDRDRETEIYENKVSTTERRTWGCFNTHVHTFTPRRGYTSFRCSRETNQTGRRRTSKASRHFTTGTAFHFACPRGTTSTPKKNFSTGCTQPTMGSVSNLKPLRPLSGRERAQESL
jgi:hypothetical protein